MKLLVRVALAAALMSTQRGITRAASVPSHPTILVFPSSVHPGDTLYVSGGGYSTNHHVPLVLACPNARTPLNGYFGVVGPEPGKRGIFVAYRMATRTPAGGGRVRCQVVARHIGRSAANASWGNPVSVTIVPAGKALPGCAVRICLRVRTAMIRLRSGAQGNIEVVGWPGAAVTITISRQGAVQMRRTLHLSWQGTGSMRVIVATGLAKGLQARIHVTARLGRAAGAVTTTFHVLPSGR